MKKILIFAGTTEGRELSERLSDAGILHVVCVAGEYGEQVLKKSSFADIHQGRMDVEEIKAFLQNGNFAAVVDATHPYAELISQNIQAAMQEIRIRIPYLRLLRETDFENEDAQVVAFDDHASCAKALEQVEGDVLLTTGSKELPVYCQDEELKKRLYVRVLPGLESLSACMEQGISGKQILALQGPFTAELNEALIHQYRIRCLVTKKSGKNGGYQEKLLAAEKTGIPVFVIGSGKEKEGDSFEEVCKKLEKICGRKIQAAKPFHIILAGAGMGSRETLTWEVRKAIDHADILLGSERMIADYQPVLEKKPYYTAGRILPYLKELTEKGMLSDGENVVVLFSGDSGFYSGCHALYQALKKELENGQFRATLQIMPGMSAVSCLAACTGESYQDAYICSIHGKEKKNLAEIIRQERKTFLLLSGVKDVNRIGELLLDAGLEACTVLTGCQLSCPEQQVLPLTPKECCERKEEGLYTCLVLNPDAQEKRVTHGRSDIEFIRGKVPMTKEEVREISICKMKLRKGSIVLDIGSGTGSVAVEIAGLSEDIQVYAVERKEEAISLLEQNKEKFRLENIEIVKTEAPEGLSGLPKATHAFVGGSGGKLKEILEVLYRMNPEMRVVMNVVSMETLCELREALALFPTEEVELVQVQVNRGRELGAYHVMQAENPVFICAFTFRARE